MSNLSTPVGLWVHAVYLCKRGVDAYNMYATEWMEKVYIHSLCINTKQLEILKSVD